MQLDRARLLWLVLAFQAVALVGVAGSSWVWFRAATQGAALAATQFVDQRLAEIDDSLIALEARLAMASVGAEPGTTCPTEVTRALLRASLDAMHAHRVWLLRGDGNACGPEGQGPGPALALPEASAQAAHAAQGPQGPHGPQGLHGPQGERTPQASPRAQTLVLVSARSIALQLVAARPVADGQLLAASLDARALALPTGGPWDEVGAAGAQVTLHSSDRRALRIWGAQSPGAAPVASLHVQQRSTRYGHTVSVGVDRASLLRRAGAHWPLAALVALIAAAGVAGFSWQRALRRSRTTHRIERALRKRQFEPFVQPIVDLASGECVGGEILMRWAHPERGTVAPGEFIEEAERTGLIVGMSELVMARAAHRLSALARQHPQLYFSFNATAGQLRRADFARRLADIFNEGTLRREQVLLELTEREALDPVTQGNLRALHAAGWRIAIDDFGTGHSSLATLEQLPIDRLKIDRAFVSAVGEQTARRPVLDAIIGLARELGLSLVAEGVETQAQWDYLARRGVGSAQGYLMARPMDLAAFERWFEERRNAASMPGAPLDALPAPASRAPVAPVSAAADGPGGDPLAALWQRMLSSGGIDIRDRMFRLRIFRRCFVGREVVDWLVGHTGVARSEALRIGRRMAALGWLRHVMDEHDFEDAELFYRVAGGEPAPAHQPAVVDLRKALHAADGPVPAEHRRGLLLHRDCLRGDTLVSWVAERYQVPRETALQWGASLMRQGRLRHVFDDRPLADGGELYRLS